MFLDQRTVDGFLWTFMMLMDSVVNNKSVNMMRYGWLLWHVEKGSNSSINNKYISTIDDPSEINTLLKSEYKSFFLLFS